MNKPPATPGELRIEAIVYKRVVSGRNQHGQQQYKYTKRRTIMVKEKRQKSDVITQAHSPVETYSSMLIGNWWDIREIQPNDVIVYGDQNLQAGIDGLPINWEQRNRWGIVAIVADEQCRYSEGVDSCYCTDEDRTPDDMPVDECETD